MNPGHEDCNHETFNAKTLADAEPRVFVQCLHDHREPVFASDGILQHAVGFHCHCCSHVLIDQNYVEGRP